MYPLRSVLVFGALSVLSISAQAQTAQIITLFNTGVASDGTLLPDGAQDPHYALIQSADPAYPGPAAFVVLDTGYPIRNPWLANGPTSKWIAPQANQNDDFGRGPGGDPPGIYVYRTTFDLTTFVPGITVITGRWATDDVGTDILINGMSTGITSHGSCPTCSGSAAFTSFSMSTAFVSGLNTLDFVMYNASPAGGERFNPTGLRVELSGTVDPVLEPGSLPFFVGMVVTGSLCARRRKLSRQ